MKQSKLLGVLAIVLALGLTACGGGNGGKSSRHVHTAAADAPWQHDDNNHWKDCIANDKGKVENAKHDFGDPTDIVPAKCEEAGSQKVTCKVCGAVVTQTIPATDHTWGEWEVVTEPGCETEGLRKHACTVCQKEETEPIEAAGHKFAQDAEGNDVVTWTKEATCDEGGVGFKTCTVCNEAVEVTTDALGHEWTTEGGTKTPKQAEGFADFWEFPCAHGCGKTSLGFKANEPTEESKSHLVIQEDGGARFWGRPIGQAMELDDDGTASGADAEKIFDETVTGDFFEYKFDLTAAQAETLSTCYCYCDAKPAAYLGGQDFWACDPSAEEWTPGYYIEGEKKGEPIADYRYILYVDGQPKTFDPTMTAPVSGRGGSEPRAEYIMPFTFNLHEGTNTIRLVMAGGYRSVFYNFYFRAAE